ncbi:MAG: carboxylating nicotinate-nucleotide diphosphorylase [Streptococcus lutetiensis]|nr:carboxylating nicotinate-nucleotide diphosphorylase [Streptococcus lutetiensis]
MLDPITLKLNVDPLILNALSEDINNEDVSTNSVMPENVAGQVDLICKEDGIICGLPVFERVFYLLDPSTQFDVLVKDGDAVKAGQKLGTVYGDIRVLLSGERTALNYLQRMSGIATYTREMAELLKDSPITLLDSRKTTPNNRVFEKYAVKIGGGKNHRYNLSDGVLLKDNHIGAAGGVKEAVEAGADIIMLDNMEHDVMKEAIALIDGRAEIEISGNVTRENLASYADLAVQYVSSGAITHSAKILDLSLKNLHPVEN